MEKDNKNSQLLGGLSDWLIRDFTIGQREYIVESLYPVLQKTLVHFVAEAKRHNQIQEKSQAQTETTPEPKNDSKKDDVTKYGITQKNKP